MIIDKDLVIVDCETSGLSKEFDDIVEFCAIRVRSNGNENEELHFFCKPKNPLSEEVSKIHGITNEFLKDQKPFSDYAKLIVEFLKGCYIGGYNILRFDLPFIQAKLKECG